jgi:ribosomal protein S18 acetylase RimI-like enzyme
VSVEAPPAVRRAGRDDLRGMAAVLTRAFHDDPVMHWFFPDHEARERRTERMFRLRVGSLLDQDETYTTDGHLGAAVWAQPGRWEMSPLRGLLLTLRLLPLTRTRTPLLASGWKLIDAQHPPEPHYYLAILGTEPNAQGRGVGSALLAPVLEDCDRNEIGAYLESSKESNLAFYARHGFRVTGELDLPEGPHVWLMWRDPRPV